MTTVNATRGVFLSYGFGDAKFGEQVRRHLVEAGLEVFDPLSSFDQGQRLEAVMRKKIAESDAVVVLLANERTLPASVVFEIGAAFAWGKTIYVVTESPGMIGVPEYLHARQVFPYSRLDELVRDLQRSYAPLTDHELTALKTAFSTVNSSTDALINDPSALHALAEEFRMRSGSDRSDESLMRDLLRLRKLGSLPRTIQK